MRAESQLANHIHPSRASLFFQPNIHRVIPRLVQRVSRARSTGASSRQGRFLEAIEYQAAGQLLQQRPLGRCIRRKYSASITSGVFRNLVLEVSLHPNCESCEKIVRCPARVAFREMARHLRVFLRSTQSTHVICPSGYVVVAHEFVPNLSLARALKWSFVVIYLG